jgi:hypothetical protein
MIGRVYFYLNQMANRYITANISLCAIAGSFVKQFNKLPIFKSFSKFCIIIT